MKLLRQSAGVLAFVAMMFALEAPLLACEQLMQACATPHAKVQPQPMKADHSCCHDKSQPKPEPVKKSCCHEKASVTTAKQCGPAAQRCCDGHAVPATTVEVKQFRAVAHADAVSALESGSPPLEARAHEVALANYRKPVFELKKDLRI